jgi:hypothetical protein
VSPHAIEQGNKNYEKQFAQHELMNCREELKSSKPDVKARIVQDAVVLKSGFCGATGP